MKIAYREALHALRANPCPRRTVIPPNRLEARNWDLLAALARPPRGDPLGALRAALQQLLGRKQVFFAPSARCAIAQLLSLLPQREVVMPAFNCDVVKSAVEAAGKRIVYVDVARGGVNATAAEFSEAAQPGRVLLATHQFGIPTDVEAICELARSRGCITIEDAACSFGATRNGQPLGTFGDFGVFSFESWKRLPAFRGGAIAVNNDRLFDPARLAGEPLVKTTSEMPVRELVSALGRNLATIPWLYGRLILPRLMRSYFKAPLASAGAGSRDVTKGSPFTRAFHPYQAQLVLRMLGRMDRIRSHIARLVSIYTDAFQDGSVATFLPSVRDDAGVLRFPIAFPGRSRAAILRQALKRGLYLETEFEEPLPDPSDHARFPNAVWAGRNLVLLPLYAALAPQDAAWLAGQVNEIAKEAPDQLLIGKSGPDSDC
jgi:dTDP-4-amino-4,6-dideoxygalactose transaminase